MTNTATRRWIFATAKKNLWRVTAHHDIDDLIQDAFLVYVRIQRRYPDATPAQQLRLFQRSYLNHIHNLARQVSKSRAVSLDLVETQPPCEFSHLMRTISEAPDIVRKVIVALATKQVPKYRVRHDNTRQTTSELMCRMIGIEPTVNVHSLLINYLKEK